MVSGKAVVERFQDLVRKGKVSEDGTQLLGRSWQAVDGSFDFRVGELPKELARWAAREYLLILSKRLPGAAEEAAEGKLVLSFADPKAKLVESLLSKGLTKAEVEELLKEL